EATRFYADCGVDARLGHRREHRDFWHLQRRVVTPVAVCNRPSTRRHAWEFVDASCVFHGVARWTTKSGTDGGVLSARIPPDAAHRNGNDRRRGDHARLLSDA